MGNTAFSEANFINRELSWLEFNRRVLMQAQDRENPLFERMNFMSIVCSNLDEFFMVRVASLRDQLNAKGNTTDPGGMSAKQQLNGIAKRVKRMTVDLYDTYIDELLPELSSHGIEILRGGELDEAQKAYCAGFFDSALYPVLTPLAIDKSHPFPFIANKALNLAVMVEDDHGEPAFATIQVPSNFPRLFRMRQHTYVPVEDVIKLNVGKLFAPLRVLSCAPYRITRNGDLEINEEEAEDLLSEIRKSLRKRKRGAVIRLEMERGCDGKLTKFFTKAFGLEKKDVYESCGPVSLTFLMKELYGLGGFDALKYEPYTPNMPVALRNSTASIFDEIKKGDILLHHPFDSFEPVVRFMEQAAADPDVVAIKQTLYRVSHNSPIIKALITAAENGKQVTALVELKARFDEENNITYGEELKRKGVNVVYGVEDLKTHSKITMVVRREEDGVRRYLHLGTGNYNDSTAKMYTDYGLLTCEESLGNDATAFFNSITGFFRKPELEHLIMAPHTLRSTVYELLEEEAEKGSKGAFYGKMNSLADPDMIDRLYRAAQAGVKIRLLVRGICCLDPTSEDAAGNIEVRSVVGRHLEHTRVYIFGNGSEQRVFLGSADLMTRNLSRRVELLFPLLDEKIRERVVEETELYWTDTAKARVLTENGKYITLSEHKPIKTAEYSIFDFGIREESDDENEPLPYVNAQEVLISRARKAMEQ